MNVTHELEQEWYIEDLKEQIKNLKCCGNCGTWLKTNCNKQEQAVCSKWLNDKMEYKTRLINIDKG